MTLLACILLSSLALAAPQADEFETSRGPVRITPLKHATFLMEAGGKAIYVDPTSQVDYGALPKAGVVLITDIHGDHMDPNALAKVMSPGALVFAPEAVAKALGDKAKVNVLKNGDGANVATIGLQIEAVPAYNIRRGPSAGKLYHDKGRGNGYVLTYGGKRFYISGDTENIPEMTALKNIDVAFLCMNLPYTMPPEEAAAAARAFHPKVVYPYHYRGSDLGVFEKALAGSGIEVRIRNWY